MKRYFLFMMFFSATVGLFGVLTKKFSGLSSNITLTNKYWEKIHVQVRSGYEPDPAKNKLIVDRYLSKGESVTFSESGPENVNYRRDVDPDNADGKHFTEWTYANCPDSNCIIDNP